MSAEVDSYFDALEHPLKDVMLAVRRVIVDADDRISESIKWKSPTFEDATVFLGLAQRSPQHSVYARMSEGSRVRNGMWPSSGIRCSRTTGSYMPS